jgi:hypothetical protein
VEVNLLRSGERLLPNATLAAYVANIEPPPAYLVLVNRTWRRVSVVMECQLFAARLPDVLPCIAILLRAEEAEVILDLQWVFNQAYDRGPYRRDAVDYDAAPGPPLTPDEIQWIRQRLRESNLQP